MKRPKRKRTIKLIWIKFNNIRGTCGPINSKQNNYLTEKMPYINKPIVNTKNTVGRCFNLEVHLFVLLAIQIIRGTQGGGRQNVPGIYFIFNIRGRGQKSAKKWHILFEWPVII